MNGEVTTPWGEIQDKSVCVCVWGGECRKSPNGFMVHRKALKRICKLLD